MDIAARAGISVKDVDNALVAARKLLSDHVASVLADTVFTSRDLDDELDGFFK